MEKKVRGVCYNAASQSTMNFIVDSNTVRYVLCTQFHTPTGYEGLLCVFVFVHLNVLGCDFVSSEATTQIHK